MLPIQDIQPVVIACTGAMLLRTAIRSSVARVSVGSCAGANNFAIGYFMDRRGVLFGLVLVTLAKLFAAPAREEKEQASDHERLR